MLLRSISAQLSHAPKLHDGAYQRNFSSIVPPPFRHAVSTRASSNSKEASKTSMPECLSPSSAADSSLKPSPAARQDSNSSSSSSSSDPQLQEQQQQQQQQQQQEDAAEDDKWGDVLSVNHTLSSLYLEQFKIAPFNVEDKQRNWEAKRRENDLKDVTQAGSKLGIKPEVIEANLQQLQALVPGLLINLDKMKASDWANLLRDIDNVVGVVITLKTHYPKIDIGSIIKRKPKLLLSTQQQVDENALKVKSILASKVQDIDSIIDTVPDLMDPQQLTQSLRNLVAWFPNHDPFELLQQNPQILENPNVEADPTYGRALWSAQD